MSSSVVDALVSVNSHKRSLMVHTVKCRTGQVGLGREGICVTDVQCSGSEHYEIILFNYLRPSIYHVVGLGLCKEFLLSLQGFFLFLSNGIHLNKNYLVKSCRFLWLTKIQGGQWVVLLQSFEAGEPCAP